MQGFPNGAAGSQSHYEALLQLAQNLEATCHSQVSAVVPTSSCSCSCVPMCVHVAAVDRRLVPVWGAREGGRGSVCVRGSS
jgi:hypothetical protein